MGKSEQSSWGEVPASLPGACAPAPPEPRTDTLEFSEERSKALMRVLTSIIWVTDPEGRFTVPQPSWSAYTGQSWAEQQGTGWFHAVHPDDREEVARCLEVAHRDRTMYHANGRLWHAPTRTWRYIEARGAPVLDDKGELLEWVGTCRDVDERKRAEAMLRDADRRKDEFIAVLAHELRNPLAPIRNAVQVLKLRGNHDMQLNWARTVIERQVAQMAHLLEDLLDVSRISQNKIELHKDRVTLDAILDAAIEISRPQWEQHGHQFELVVLAGPIEVEADPPRLIQAFSNLLNNAAKYTDRGGRISLTVRHEGGFAIVDVADTGIGITPEMLPKLFDLFTQDKPALERSQGGLGIGLSIVRALVEMHGGTVEATSAGLGRGSCFTVRLPAVPRRGGGTAVHGPAPGSQPPLRILVADDNLDAAETLSVLLEMQGHQVRVACDGDEALLIAAQFAPDVALLDIGMPKRNGYDVASELRSRAPQTVLVAVTGWGQRDDMRKAAAAGFDHHLVKPVDPENLATVLAQAARARKTQ